MTEAKVSQAGSRPAVSTGACPHGRSGSPQPRSSRRPSISASAGAAENRADPVRQPRSVARLRVRFERVDRRARIPARCPTPPCWTPPPTGHDRTGHGDGYGTGVEHATGCPRPYAAPVDRGRTRATPRELSRRTRSSTLGAPLAARLPSLRGSARATSRTGYRETRSATVTAFGASGTLAPAITIVLPERLGGFARSSRRAGNRASE
jgi:hypothetical protein